jgi:hypothetical protein
MSASSSVVPKSQWFEITLVKKKRGERKERASYAYREVLRIQREVFSENSEKLCHRQKIPEKISGKGASDLRESWERVS